MKKKNTAPSVELGLEPDDAMLPEYDLRQMRVVKRGPGYTQPRAAQAISVTLDPDVAAVFKDQQAVNEALRALLRVIAAAQDARATTFHRPLSEGA